MSLRSKYGLLVKHDDIFSKFLNKKQMKKMAVKISLDMYTLHRKIESRQELINILITYFKNRPGIIDEECSGPKDQAFKMILLGDFAEITKKIVEISGCKPDDINFKINWGDDSVEISTGIKRGLDVDEAVIIEKLLDILMPSTIKGFTEEHNSFINNESEDDCDVEIDEETRKALEKMNWDKKSSGKA